MHHFRITDEHESDAVAAVVALPVEGTACTISSLFPFQGRAISGGTSWALPIGDSSSLHLVLDVPDEPRTLQLVLNEVDCSLASSGAAHLTLVLGAGITSATSRGEGRFAIRLRGISPGPSE